VSLLSRMMPDFLGIGAQRAGTTWLWVHLRRHPQIWMPRRKELHFFDRRRALGSGPAAAAFARVSYAAWFVPGRLRRHVVGEVTPAYATLADERVALIASWMPRARIIYLIRDPVERAWSAAAKGFARWAGRELADAKEEELLSFFRLPDVSVRGDYVFAVKTWRRHFPADQILVCASEQMFADPLDHLRRVYRFLGVDPEIPLDAAPLRARVHAGATPPIPPRVRRALGNGLYAQREELESLLGFSLPWNR
jgi:hypothetical protein